MLWKMEIIVLRFIQFKRAMRGDIYDALLGEDCYRPVVMVTHLPLQSKICACNDDAWWQNGHATSLNHAVYNTY